MNHNVFLKIIKGKIRDERLVRLLIKALKAGYFEFKKYHHSIIGTHQGSIISLIPSDIYWDRLDGIVVEILETFNIGAKLKANLLYISYRN